MHSMWNSASVCIFDGVVGRAAGLLFVVCSLFMFTHFSRALRCPLHHSSTGGGSLIIGFVVRRGGGLRGGISGRSLCVSLLGGCDAAFAWCSVLFA